MSEIKKTNKYDMFKFSKVNAPINYAHVDKIAASIKIKNMLHMRAIMVNEDMEIIDGQHRLLAAKKVGVDIYYQIDETLSDDDMAILNSNARIWGPGDFLHHFVSRGNENYKKLNNFLKVHDLKLYDGLALLGKGGGGVAADLRAGTFQFPDPNKAIEAAEGAEKIKEILNYISDTSINRLPFLNHKTVFRSLIPLVTHPDFDLKLMLRKIDMLLPKIIKKADTQSYFEMFRDIYNWKNQNPLTWD